MGVAKLQDAAYLMDDAAAPKIIRELYHVGEYGGFLKWGCPKMDC